MVTKTEPPAMSPAESLPAVSMANLELASTPRVSVIMPVFNGARTLDRALDSLLRQTFPRWELLAIDDASTDDSHERLIRWSRRDQRRVLRHGENRGPAAARNEGRPAVASTTSAATASAAQGGSRHQHVATIRSCCRLYRGPVGDAETPLALLRARLVRPIGLQNPSTG
jgi:hypothetical protein